MIINYNFEVDIKESGQRKSYGDSYYTYEVTSDRHEHEVKNFCTNVLKKSYEHKNMPDPFAGRILEFKKISSDGERNTYSYKVKTEYTG